ncbi:MAG TPA: lytic transglycosylase domain-containing protein [Thermoanaerobaculia bacterium]|nr:lytic transglycosylase domain-containing protein [Thermoanaerobaculia bacterium]
MAKTKRGLVDVLRSRFATRRAKKGSAKNSAFIRTRRGLTVILGAALSVGGVTEAFNGVHFLVQKDLDQVRVVKQRGDDSKVVARFNGDFAANSIFKIARVLPERYVTDQLDLFGGELFADSVIAREGLTVGKKLALMNDSMSEQFFNATIPFGSLIHRKAAKYEVDPNLVAAVIEAESRFKRTARSPVGARGLMQLMPKTGRWMGASNLYDADQNVDAGVKYLKYLDKRFNGDLTNTIAAYNAGEGTVRRYGGIPPYNETQTYVKKVMKNYKKRNAELKQYNETAGASESDESR